MCNPLAFGAALMAAGTAAQMKGQNDAEKERKNVRRREEARQELYKKDAESAFEGNRKALQVEEVTGKMASNQAAREEAYKAASMAAPRSAEMAASGSLGGNKVVAANLGEVLAGVNQRVAQTGQARADLASFGDAMFDTSILTGRGREGIAMAADHARGSMRVLPWELEGANRKGAAARTLGQIASTVGGAMIGGAGAAAGGAGAAAGGANMTPYLASSAMASGNLLGPWGKGLSYAAGTP